MIGEAITLAAWRRLLRSPAALEASTDSTPPVLLVDLDGGAAAPAAEDEEIARCAMLSSLPVVVVGVSAEPGPEWNGAALVDTVVAPSSSPLRSVLGNVERHPLTAVACALLLRQADRRTVAEGLAAESATYSTLQGGPEFARWRASRPRRAPSPHDAAAPPVLVTRTGDVLDVALNRPHVHNALNARMREELRDALVVAVADPSLTVRLRGNGASFCSGGDLDEFGTFADPATAHVLRLGSSPARLMALLAHRTEVRLHGACYGAGVELPAFSARVAARPDSRFGLPELGLGLVPGAGGTVSLPRRIGRHRTALLALSAEPVDAVTALEWGLVDSVSD